MKSAPTDKTRPAPPPDTLNTIGVLKRREIEARILKPLLEALANEFGRDRVFAIAQSVIVAIAREQGAALAAQVGGCSLAQFAGALDDWQRGDAYCLDVLEQNDRQFSFNVTRCRYAEMYRSLGIPELGRLLSCNRDFSLVEGFSPTIKLTRTQTIMEGADHCDFRFVEHGAGATAAAPPVRAKQRARKRR
jgi:L-2-amino-thiazoline-4-carboxylic acid hydrolase